MKTKKILITCTIIIILSVTILFLYKYNSKVKWINEIKNSDYYEIYLLKCDSSKKTINESKLEDIYLKMNNLTDNGPWTGNQNECYDKLIIEYKINNTTNKKEILITSENTLVTMENNIYKYYTNSKELYQEIYN